jgi:hypothetical protein
MDHVGIILICQLKQNVIPERPSAPTENYFNTEYPLDRLLKYLIPWIVSTCSDISIYLAQDGFEHSSKQKETVPIKFPRNHPEVIPFYIN